MNFQEIRIAIVILIYAILEKSNSSRISFSNLDKKQISEAFAELLNSLIRVNEERVEALNNFFKLNDFNVAQEMLRSGQEENREPIVALIVTNQDKGIKHQLQIDDKKSDSSSESDISSDITEERSDRFDSVPLRIRKIKDLTESESSNEVLSTEKKPPFNYSDTILTDSSLEDDEIKPKKASRLSNCIQNGNAFRKCYSACKEAYRHSCYYYICSRSLYRRLRKECRTSCRFRFRNSL